MTKFTHITGSEILVLLISACVAVSAATDCVADPVNRELVSMRADSTPTHAAATDNRESYPDNVHKPNYYDMSQIDLALFANYELTPQNEPPILHLSRDFVDRSEIANVLRERRSLELVKFWESRWARLYLGVGPTGLAGFNLTQQKSPKKKPQAELPDYESIIAGLTASDGQSELLPRRRR